MLKRIEAPDYSRPVFTPEICRFTVQKVKELIQEKFPHVQAIAARGNSGIPLASIVAYELGLPLIAVRRDAKESPHDESPVNGFAGSGPYVIIDDLIDSGTTIRAILRAIEGVNPNTRCAGIVLYRGDRNTFNGIPVFNVSYEVTKFTQQFNLHTAHLQTPVLLMNAVNIWSVAHSLRAKLENGQVLLGRLDQIWNTTFAENFDDWCKRLRDREFPNSIVLLTKEKLFILPADTSKEKLASLWQYYPSLGFVSRWTENSDSSIDEYGRKLELVNEDQLPFRDDLVLDKPGQAPEATPVEEKPVEEKAEPKPPETKAEPPMLADRVSKKPNPMGLERVLVPYCRYCRNIRVEIPDQVQFLQYKSLVDIAGNVTITKEEKPSSKPLDETTSV